MTGTLGRTQQKRLCMISGNRNGLIGMATIQAGFGGGMASKRIDTFLYVYIRLGKTGSLRPWSRVIVHCSKHR